MGLGVKTRAVGGLRGEAREILAFLVLGEGVPVASARNLKRLGWEGISVGGGEQRRECHPLRLEELRGGIKGSDEQRELVHCGGSSAM